MTDATTLYASALREARTLEEGESRRMRSLFERLGDYPRFAAIVRDRIEVTNSQVERLDRLLGEVGVEPSSLKAATTAAAGLVSAAAQRLASTGVLDELHACYGFLHEQVAIYKSLAVLAKAAGNDAHTVDCREAVEEEKRGAAELEDIVEDVTHDWLTRTADRV